MIAAIITLVDIISIAIFFYYYCYNHYFSYYFPISNDTTSTPFLSPIIQVQVVHPWSIVVDITTTSDKAAAYSFNTITTQSNIINNVLATTDTLVPLLVLLIDVLPFVFIVVLLFIFVVVVEVAATVTMKDFRATDVSPRN